MYLRLSRKTKVGWNTALLVCATFFLIVIYGFTYQRSFVDEFGIYITGTYIEYRKAQRNTALKALKQGDLDTVIDLLEDWEAFRKGDRVYPLKRRLLLRLAEELNTREKYDELTYWTTVWVGLDDRDITARAYYLQALRHDSERYREALDGLAREHQRFPLNRALTRFYADAHEVPVVDAGENIDG